ncbi:hypothetical protein BH23PLA1_BH23PLA1_24760 [soil metagenome]
MSYLHNAMLVALLFLAVSTRVDAEFLLVSTITNDQEVPPANPTDTQGNPRPASFGEATLILNEAMTALTYSVTLFNVDFTGIQSDDPNDNLVAAHIHRAPFGSNGPVIFGFFGSPLSDNNPNDVVVTPFSTGVGGTITGKWDLMEGNNTTLTAEIPHLLAGNTYLNFHTVQFPGGELRGQIVPEPSAAVLLGIGIGAAAFIGSRKRFKKRAL